MSPSTANSTVASSGSLPLVVIPVPVLVCPGSRRCRRWCDLDVHGDGPADLYFGLTDFAIPHRSIDVA
jgi:hypothetical protein